MHLESALVFLPYGTMVDEFQHRVYAAFQRRLQHAAQRRAQSTRRTRAGEIRDAASNGVFDDLHIVFHARFQFRADFRRCALLRAVGVCRARRAQQRVRHVAQHGDAAIRKFRHQPGKIRMADIRQRPACWRNRLSLPICEHRAQGAEHPQPAVIRCASANANQQ